MPVTKGRLSELQSGGSSDPLLGIVKLLESLLGFLAKIQCEIVRASHRNSQVGETHKANGRAKGKECPCSLSAHQPRSSLNPAILGVLWRFHHTVVMDEVTDHW